MYYYIICVIIIWYMIISYFGFSSIVMHNTQTIFHLLGHKKINSETTSHNVSRDRC
jgi:hypothetical protein